MLPNGRTAISKVSLKVILSMTSPAHVARFRKGFFVMTVFLVLKVEYKAKTKTTKSAHATFDAGTYKSLQKLTCFPARPPA